MLAFYEEKGKGITYFFQFHNVFPRQKSIQYGQNFRWVLMVRFGKGDCRDGIMGHLFREMT